jgi:hypothetical protein
VKRASAKREPATQQRDRDAREGRYRHFVDRL